MPAGRSLIPPEQVCRGLFVSGRLFHEWTTLMAGENGSWFRSYRKESDSAVFNFKDAGIYKVWRWCLNSTNYGECFFEGVKIMPGEFVTGRESGAKKCRMRPSTFWEKLLKLQQMGNISLKSNNKFTIVSICNWPTYNGDEYEIRQQPDNGPTTARQQPDNGPTQEKKNIEELEEKEELEHNTSRTTTRRTLHFSEDDMATAQWMFAKIVENDPAAKPPKYETWANEIRKMREIDSRPDSTIRQVFSWASADHFWRANILSPTKLREKFTTLLLQKDRPNGNGKHKPSYGPGQLFEPETEHAF